MGGGGKLIRKGIEREEGWRMPMWRSMANCLPSRVMIDLKGSFYNVKDGSNAYIYADDLDRRGYDEIIADGWKLCFHKKKEAFCSKFSLKEIREGCLPRK